MWRWGITGLVAVSAALTSAALIRVVSYNVASGPNDAVDD